MRLKFAGATMDKNGILLFDIDGQETREIVAILSALGHAVQLYVDIESGMHWYRENSAAIYVMVNVLAMPAEVFNLFTLIRAIAADAIILVTAPADRMGAAIEGAEYCVCR